MTHYTEATHESKAAAHLPYYGQIVKATSITGGSQGLVLFIRIMRTKVVALLLGPAGTGEISLLMAALDLLAKFCGMGIGTSGIREIADAYSRNDQLRLAKTVGVLRRVCWVTGLLGWLMAIGLAHVLSQTTFGTSAYAIPLMVIGVTVFFDQLAAGQAVILRGTRRIGDMARQSVLGTAVGTIVGISLYGVYGRNAIPAVIVITSACSLGVSWWFSRRVECNIVDISWQETVLESRRLMSIGIAFMFSGLIGSLVNWLIKSMIAHEFGTEGNGIYDAAWSLSLQFAGFILTAMAGDYYPRLSGLASDFKSMNRLVNEQTEIGVLLALPGLIATIAFAPWVIYLFYSSRYATAAELLPWFVVGVFGRVVSWPLGYLQLALGRGRLFLATETVFGVLHVGLVALFSQLFALQGVAASFAVLYAIYSITMAFVAARLTAFRWASPLRRLLWHSCLLIMVAFLASWLMQPWCTLTLGAISALSLVYSIKGLVIRLGPDHRFSRWAKRVPWLG